MMVMIWGVVPTKAWKGGTLKWEVKLTKRGIGTMFALLDSLSNLQIFQRKWLGFLQVIDRLEVPWV